MRCLPKAVLTVLLLIVIPMASQSVANLNACLNVATGLFEDAVIEVEATALPSSPVQLSGTSLDTALPGSGIFLAAYSLGLLAVGPNAVPVDGALTIEAADTAEGSQTLLFSGIGSTTIVDSDTIPGTGDESVTPLAVSTGIANSDWNRTGSGSVFRQGPIDFSILIAGGLLVLELQCEPGFSVDADMNGSNETFTPTLAAPFARRCGDPANPLEDDLLARWDFAGDALDATGCELDGSTIGATLTADRFGAPDSAYAFDGVDDSIGLGFDPWLKPPLPLTVALWVRHACASGEGCGLFDNNTTPGVYSGLWINLDGTTGRWNVNLGDGGSPSSVNRRSGTAATALSPSTWHHLAAVVHSATDMDLYIDGVPDAVTYSGTGSAFTYLGGSAAIGNDANSSGPWNGDLDEVYFWGRALDATEVDQVFQLPEPDLRLGLAAGLALVAALGRRRRPLG